MKPLEELDHYELLELDRDAAPEEVERAYRMASAAFAEGSMAAYGVYDDGELKDLRERVDQAWRVLIDPEARRSYDAGLGGVEHTTELVPLDLEDAGIPAHEPPLAGFEDMDEGEVTFDGARLRRSRLQRGIDLDELSRVTRIKPSYLCALEEDRFGDLPAPVYVRGFVNAYARCLGLEPRAVVDGYMGRLDQMRRPAAPARGRR